MSEGNSYKLKFKMFMEGVTIPFKSAMISCTPNGVECNIVMNPSDKIFDLKPKTFVQIFYYDWFGPKTNRAIRLLGDGYFSGFAKSDDAGGMRSVSIICRDFRMDIRKTPAAMVYMPPEYFSRGNLFNISGIRQKSVLVYKKGEGNTGEKKNEVASRSFGGSLNNYYVMINIIAGTATGDGVASSADL